MTDERVGCCEEHFPSEAMDLAEQLAHVCPNCGREAIDSIRALVAAFSPKTVPLDVDENGGYAEATTRWGLNPIYEAVPLELRLGAEEEMLPYYRDQIQAMRAKAEA